ncbi:MAG: hypothetical protein HKO88_15960 [Xanthomonadales bacterium]|nr:hypothetical protein [Xanthomonadales bacterium]
MNTDSNLTSKQVGSFPRWLRVLITVGFILVAVAGAISITQGSKLGWVELVAGIVVASCFAVMKPKTNKIYSYRTALAIAAIVLIVMSGARIVLHAIS